MKWRPRAHTVIGAPCRSIDHGTWRIVKHAREQISRPRAHAAGPDQPWASFGLGLRLEPLELAPLLLDFALLRLQLRLRLLGLDFLVLH